MKPRNIDAIRELIGGRVSGHPDSYSPTFHDNQKCPSKEEIDTKLASMVSDWEAQDYSRKREAEYPSIAELTIALYDTDDKAAIDAKRAAVKAKYPKPS